MWKMIISGGWMAIPFAIAAVAVVQWTSVNPKKKKLEKAELAIAEKDASIVALHNEIDISESAVEALLEERHELQGRIEEDSINHHDQLVKNQHVMAQLNNKLKGKDDRIADLLTGIQVDVKTYWIKKKLFGGEEIVDSTYQEAVRYGSLKQ